MTQTWYAPPERSSPEHLVEELNRVSANPVMDEVLKVVGGLVAILNERRQVIAVNDRFLKDLSIEKPEDIFGLRLGEIIDCVHAHSEPAGCGTTRHCSSCGAAIAMVTSLAEQRPVERICAAEVNQNGVSTDLYFQVRAVPLRCEGQRFLLVFLRDITRQQQLAAEERAFFHDVKNILCGLQGAAEMMVFGGPETLASSGRVVRKLVQRLNTELELQKVLASSVEHEYQPTLAEVSVPDVLNELREEFRAHPAMEGKRIVIDTDRLPWRILTDECVLFRVLRNMLINALEASERGDEVRIAAEPMDQHRMRFAVWNRGWIPSDVQLRVFQRNFSTKKGEGRGMGTWSMKFFGEKFLNGQVGFTSAPDTGTLFFLVLPGLVQEPEGL